MIGSRHVRFAYFIKVSRYTCLLRPVLLASASGWSTHIEGDSVDAPTVAARAPRLRASGVLSIVIEPRGTRRACFHILGSALTPQVQILPKRRLQFPAIIIIWRPPTTVEHEGATLQSKPNETDMEATPMSRREAKRDNSTRHHQLHSVALLAWNCSEGGQGAPR